MVGAIAFALAQAGQPTPAELASTLFRLAGFESPAGGEYRKVTVTIPLVAFGERVVNLDAWVVTDPLTGKRKAVAWNGMAYEPKSVGEPADLEADIARRRAINEPYLPMESLEYEAAFTTYGPAAGAMLSLLGRQDLADKACKEVFFRATTSSDPRFAAAALADRILCDAAAARTVHGHDYEALLLARRALRFRGAFDEIADASGARFSTVFGSNDTETLRDWVTTLNLRVSRPVVLPDMSQAAKMTREERVRAYTDALDLETGTRMYITGEAPPDVDGPAERLAREGDEGVRALIASLGDQRITRAVYGNAVPMSPYRFATVGEVARRTLEGAMGLTGFSANPDKQREEVTRLWERSVGKPQEERWLVALEDDAMPMAVWANAARSLSVPSWVTVNPYGASMSGGLPAHFTGPSIKWTALYASKRGRVFRALEKRARAMLAVPGRNLPLAHDTALAAAVYDVKKSVPLLRALRAEVLRRTGDSPESSDLAYLSGIVSAMLTASAPDAWEGYEELVLKTGPRRPTLGLDVVLAPLWQHPDDPTSQRIAAEVFGAGKQWSAVQMVSESFDSRLPAVSFLRPFQDALLAGLRDSSVVVTARRDSKTFVRFTDSDGHGTRGFAIDPGRASVEVGGSIELRRCDLLMAKLKGAFRDNAFDVGATVADRDKWTAAAVASMSREGFSWEVNPVPLIAVTEPVFVSRAIWPEPFARVRPGTFVRGGQQRE